MSNSNKSIKYIFYYLRSLCGKDGSKAIVWYHTNMLSSLIAGPLSICILGFQHLSLRPAQNSFQQPNMCSVQNKMLLGIWRLEQAAATTCRNLWHTVDRIGWDFKGSCMFKKEMDLTILHETHKIPSCEIHKFLKEIVQKSQISGSFSSLDFF